MGSGMATAGGKLEVIGKLGSEKREIIEVESIKERKQTSVDGVH